ncbi:hypothetical protein J6590_013665 [Homalodisca vitripennis]|nr:hypothetical protein J6590_013665 [Homalodisca vitripennis]
MFSFDVKEIFQRKIVETLITLLIIHIGTVVFSFVVRWVHPHLKNYVARDKRAKSSKLLKENCESLSTNNDEDNQTEECMSAFNDSMDGLYLDLLDNLKSFVDVEVSEISSEILNDDGVKYTNSLNNLIVGIEETVNLRRILREASKKNLNSSEVQTIISIHPKRKLQYILPELISPHLSSDVSITPSTPDQFESASSGDSEYTDTEGECIPVANSVDYTNSLKHQQIEKNVRTVKFESAELNSESKDKPFRNFKNITYTESLISKKYERRVSLENKILETAITEFEKELKPIKDQIKVLKECLSGFDSVSSDVSSSITGTVGQFERLSQVVSSTCSSDVRGSVSSPFSDTVVNPCVTPKDKSKLNSMIESLPVTPIQLSKDKYKFSDTICNNTQSFDVRHSSVEQKKSKNRSPLADMYVKLSHCGSQPNYVLKSNNFNTTQYEENKGVTCRINLNLNLGPVSFSSNHEMNSLKKQKILPLLSGPQDLFDKALETNKSLRPSKLS